MKKLPLGVQSFEVLREGDHLYVDKTEHIYRLIDRGMYYFLARPRRFGKSLLVSTLKCLFQGRRALFEGLWIAENNVWDWQQNYPVVLLNFNDISRDTPENLKLGLERTLHQAAAEYQTELAEPLLVGKFKELIFKLHHKTERPVVVLIDEYDKPLIDHLGKGAAALEIAKANRDILKSFFGVIKGEASPILRFVFLTGISRFSKVSIFSELNSLSDLSMDQRYATLLGYTAEELQHNFPDHLQQFAAQTNRTVPEISQKLTTHYNGYRFSAKDVKVYNPYSILKAFDQQEFGSYWFETATPSFLVNLLRERNYPLSQMENLEVTESAFGAYDLENLQPEALLFQTGYLTIKDCDDRLFTMGYPNQEVKTGFTERLLNSYATPVSGLMSAQIFRLSRYLERSDLDAFFETVNALFATIPHDKLEAANEAYFHTLFYLMVAASGVDARSEVLGHKGRMDLAVIFTDKVFVVEFKCGQGVEAALQQIKAKGYADRYRQTGRAVFLLGIDFDSAQRQVGAWKVETQG